MEGKEKNVTLTDYDELSIVTEHTKGISPRLADVLAIQPPPAEVTFVSPLEVVAIHYRLATDFRESPDPISPTGVRDPNLLASAVARQWAGEQGRLLHAKPIDNASTLFYGLCLNHCFFNGNKRTAFVATLVHLDRNGLVLRGASDQEIYALVTDLASHQLRHKSNVVPRREELGHVTRWLRARTSPIQRGDRPITFRQLRRILKGYKCELRNPDRNFIDIYAVEDEKHYSFFGLSFRRRVKERRVLALSYAGEHEELSKKTLKKIREACHLTEADGIDSAAFYDQEAILDYFINRYRTVLRRLAKT